MAPLKILLSYEQRSQHLKHLNFTRCYYSWQNIVPTPTHHDGVVYNSPKLLTFQSDDVGGDSPQKKNKVSGQAVQPHGRQLFQQQALFITFEPVQDCVMTV